VGAGAGVDASFGHTAAMIAASGHSGSSMSSTSKIQSLQPGATS